MYRREALIEALEHSRSTGYEFLAESIVQLHGLGRVIEEIPFVSRHAHGRRTNVPGSEIAWPVAANLPRLWKLRNSVFSADYDERAFNSWIWPQRYWQRKRFEIITSLVESPADVLDVGCGSSKIIQAYPGAIGLDIQLKKLRYLLWRHTRLVQASAFRLPFADHSFRTVICSEVIEHIPFAEVLFDEFRRVLRPGGVLVLGTPDYGTWIWPTIEWLYGKIIPGGYAQEHITHYTAASLSELLRTRGFSIEAERRICAAELILKARLEMKREATPAQPSRPVE
jgi:ubiquinone/menaquinone biosynthesis C-methylase UbiE